MANILSKEIAYKSLTDFFGNNKPFVLFGTGTSCAVDNDFGMDALKKCLLEEIPKHDLCSEQQAQWEAVVKALAVCNDLESAMNTVVNDELTQVIVKCTGGFVAALDKKYSTKIMSGNIHWPAIKLFDSLVKGLPETDRKLHVATPNYDLMAEYAFERANIHYSTGYVGGVCRRSDWSVAERSMLYEELVTIQGKPKKSPKMRRHICLHKVHGSLNTFLLNNSTLENNSWIYDVPEGIERLMVTPGTSKFGKLHENRHELLGQFDQAMADHNAFLFIGFGFNDSQLNNRKIMEKLVDQKCHGLIITRDTNDRIDKLMKVSDNLWLVCKHQDSDNDGTRIYNNKYSNWLYLDDKKLWDTDVFATEILGG